MMFKMVLALSLVALMMFKTVLISSVPGVVLDSVN